jgi:hypothetical protein
MHSLWDQVGIAGEPSGGFKGDKLRRVSAMGDLKETNMTTECSNGSNATAKLEFSLKKKRNLVQ